MTIIDKLKRLILPYKQNAIAEAAGVSVNTLIRIINGTRQPRIETAKKIAAAFGVDPFWLMDDSKSWPPVRTGRPATDDLASHSTTAA